MSHDPDRPAAGTLAHARFAGDAAIRKTRIGGFTNAGSVARSKEEVAEPVLTGKRHVAREVRP